LVVALTGPETLPVEINLVGRVDTKDGGIRTSFETVPALGIDTWDLIDWQVTVDFFQSD
jgi:hypothetical protein